MNQELNGVVMQAKGVNGQIYVGETEIIIGHKGAIGFLTQGMKGMKHIPIASITSVQVKEPGLLTNGFIQFGVMGGVESRGGIRAAVHDENTVMFYPKHKADFLKIASYLRQKIADRSKPAAAAPVSAAGELEKLAGLLEKGLITRDEFDAQKARLLGAPAGAPATPAPAPQAAAPAAPKPQRAGAENDLWPS